jgi:hypothetical protein
MFIHVCENYAHQVKVLDDTTLFCYFKAYETSTSNTFGNLMMPHDNFKASYDLPQ